MEIISDFMKRSKTSRYHAGVVCSIIMISIFFMDINLPLGIAVDIFYVIAIVITLWYPTRTFILSISVACSLLTIIGYFLSPSGREIVLSISNRGLALGVIWIVTVLTLHYSSLMELRDQLLREREEALQQIKILEGLLPTCSYCRRIRDDSWGWIQMESYISKHSEAEFSHGICPDCLRKQFPDLAEKVIRNAESQTE